MFENLSWNINRDELWGLLFEFANNQASNQTRFYLSKQVRDLQLMADVNLEIVVLD